MQQNDSFGATIGWIARLRLKATTVAGGWLIGSLVFLVALTARLNLEPVSPADPFVTFHLALVLIALACGWRRAMFFAALAAAATWFFFLRAPGLQPTGAGGTVLTVGGFALVGGLEIALCEILARAAAVLAGGPSTLRDPRLAALHRRAETAVRFVAGPVLSSPAAAADAAAMIDATRKRRDLFSRLDATVLDPFAAPDDWSGRMEHFCRAELAKNQAAKPVCSVTGDAGAVDADRLLAISLAIGDMLHQAMTARCSVFDVALVSDGMGGRRLDIRTAGCRAPRWEAPAAAPWTDVTHWLAQLLDATLTVTSPGAGDGEPGVRFDFAG